MCNRGIWNTVIILLKRLIKQPKLYLVVALLVTTLDTLIGSARQIVAQYNIHVNAYGSFACLTSYNYLMLWVVLGYLVLISDVPFVTNLSLFVHIRITQRQSWTARMIYILITSILYVLFVFILIAVIEIASLMHPFTWDKALNTMSYGSAVGNSYLYTPAVILSSYTPLQACLLASVLLVCSLSALGSLMLIGTAFIGKRIVLSIAGVIAILDSAIGYMGLPDALYYISPLSWCRLEIIKTASFHPSRPSELYCLLAPFCSFLLLFLLACIVLIQSNKRFESEMNIGGEYSD